jgi:hypothetical protein
MKAKLIKTDKSGYILIDTTKNIYDEGYLLGTSKESLLNRLSLKNCETIELGYDLDELAKECSIDWNGEVMDSSCGIYKEGFQKALSILDNKKFSEEQVLDAFYAGWISQDKLYLESKIIQKTKWDVEIEMESVLIGQCDCPCHDGEDMMHMMACCNPKMVDSPKLDADGCLILKRK